MKFPAPAVFKLRNDLCQLSAKCKHGDLCSMVLISVNLDSENDSEATYIKDNYLKNCAVSEAVNNR